jgi:hypothetical protein
MNEGADDTDDEDKKKAYEYDVHEQYLSREGTARAVPAPAGCPGRMITKVQEPAFYSRSDMNNENALRARFVAGLQLKYREQYIPGRQGEPVLGSWPAGKLWCIKLWCIGNCGYVSRPW